MAHAKTHLTFVEEPSPGATILMPEVEPGFKGEEAEDLLCGACGANISRGVSLSAITARFPAPIQLLVKCPICGKHNSLSAEFIH